jgi:hypothetical protein
MLRYALPAFICPESHFKVLLDFFQKIAGVTGAAPPRLAPQRHLKRFFGSFFKKKGTRSGA